ncbi:MAG: hypothetical protein A3G95_08405 [Flavobacteria bacterium RIFCSPLOWO2_12_FULL_31_7]|nr:MAG: hypothetical protein A3G95_08405 [Flavobacteria bacterium RIFCSPLOWO2_12_FULL_31_7]
MKMKFFVTVFAGIALLLTSCSGNNNKEILKLTNEKTLAIVKFNIDDVIKKLPKEKILADTVHKFSNADKEFRLFVRADELGIDTDNPFYVTTESEKDKFITSCIFWLDDEVLFLKKFKEIYSKELTIDYEKNLVFAEKEVVGAFKDGIFVLSNKSYDPYTSRTRQYDYYYNEYEQEDMSVSKEFYANFFTRKAIEDENIIDNIDTALKDDADASIWVNLHGIVSNVSKGYIETLAINRLLIGAGFGFNLTFGEGSIQAKGESFFNDDMKKIVEKYYDNKDINYDIVKNVELDNAHLYSIGFFSTDFIKYFIKEAGFEATANKFLETKDLTVEGILSTFNGQFVMANYGETTSKIESYDGSFYDYKQPNTLILFGLNSKKSDKVMNLFNDPNLKLDDKFFRNDKYIAFSTDQKNFNLMKSNKPAKNSKLNKVTGVTSYGYGSGKELNEAMKSNVKNPIEEMISTSKISDGKAVSDITVTFEKKDKNILHYILGYE